jgi:hypothetical protein
MVRRLLLLLALVASFASFGCKQETDPSYFRRSNVAPRFRSQAILRERGGSGELEYLGLDASPESPARGESVTLTHYWKVRRPPSSNYDVFVHGDLPGGGRVLVADHAPLLGRFPTERWIAGDVYADEQRVHVPDDLQGSALEIWVGLFQKDLRFTVEAPPGASDGRDRIKAATLSIGGAAPKDDLPIANITRAEGAIVADGKLDEVSWQKAEVLEFKDTMGRDVPTRFPTKLRLLYDDQNLYVGFESVDHDITERFKDRDDPIYDHETVELFIMPKVIAPALGPYVELQASPTGVIFDASFDGPRQGMNKAYGADQIVGTVLDGTLNDDVADRGWVSEWVVPFAKIRGVDQGPKPGDEWRLNAFRIEKYKQGGQLAGEYTAWSPPKVGDFHAVARFGRMKFLGAPGG